MHPLDEGIYPALLRRGVSRRSFIKFSAAMASALALPTAYGPRIAAAVEKAPRIPLVWLRGQACGADGQALLQTADPTVQEIVLDLLAVDYADAIAAQATDAAGPSPGPIMGGVRYIAVVEGSIPTGADGTYCLVGGRPFAEVAREVCAGAVATIAVGSCAFDGGLSAASGGTTAAVGAGSVAPAGKLINLPGCPLNADNLTATVVHFLTFGELPAADRRGRPLFAYGGLIHNQCERRAHFEFGEFVLAWGDEAAQKGWCLYKMGCKGPEAFANCPTVGYASGTSWPVQAGHGCIGCTMPGFWDAMGPAYARLPAPLPFAPNITADQIGQVALGGVAALAVAHGAASWVRGRRARTAGHGASVGTHLAVTAEPDWGPAGPARIPTEGVPADLAPEDVAPRADEGPTPAGDVAVADAVLEPPLDGASSAPDVDVPEPEPELEPQAGLDEEPPPAGPSDATDGSVGPR